MSNQNIGTIENDTIQNSPVSGGGHHQIFIGSNGSKFTGYFHNNEATGYGIYSHPDNGTYKGNYRNLYDSLGMRL